jgi:hypothetical protein
MPNMFLNKLGFFPISFIGFISFLSSLFCCVGKLDITFCPVAGSTGFP